MGEDGDWKTCDLLDRKIGSSGNSRTRGLDDSPPTSIVHILRLGADRTSREQHRYLGNTDCIMSCWDCNASA